MFQLATSRRTPGDSGLGRVGRNRTVALRKGFEPGGIVRPDCIAHLDRRGRKIVLGNPGENLLGPLDPSGIRSFPTLWKMKPIVGSHLGGIEARKRQQQLGFWKILVILDGHQVANEFHAVVVEQRPKKLGCEMAVTVFDLMKILNAMGSPGPLALSLRGGTPARGRAGRNPMAHQLGTHPSQKRRGVHGGRSTLVFELIWHSSAPIRPANDGRTSVGPDPERNPLGR